MTTAGDYGGTFQGVAENTTLFGFSISGSLSRSVLYSLLRFYGKKSGPGPLVRVPNSSRKFWISSESRKSDRACAPAMISPGNFLGLASITMNGRRMTGSCFTSDLHPARVHLLHVCGNIADDDVGVVGAGKLQDVPFGNGVVADDPIALRFDAGRSPKIVREFAAADALKIDKLALWLRRFSSMRRRRWSCREHAPDRLAGRRCKVHCGSTGAC